MPNLNIEFLMAVGRTLLLAALLLWLAIVLLRWRRHAQRDTRRLADQLDLVCHELTQLSLRLTPDPDAIPTITELARAQHRAMPPMPIPQGYEVATRFARAGASCEELISNCGLSRHEAQLLLRLHGPRAARGR